MRTVIVVAMGIALAFVFQYCAERLSFGFAAFWAFAIVWALFCVGDTWFGVTKAGYALQEEVIIHAVIFLIPVLVFWGIRAILALT